MSDSSGLPVVTFAWYGQALDNDAIIATLAAMPGVCARVTNPVVLGLGFQFNLSWAELRAYGDAIEQACPQCGVGERLGCVTAGGSLAREPHRIRMSPTARAEADLRVAQERLRAAKAGEAAATEQPTRWVATPWSDDDLATLVVPCDYCGQPAGRLCRTSGNYTSTGPHAVRRSAWREHDAAARPQRLSMVEEEQS